MSSGLLITPSRQAAKVFADEIVSDSQISLALNAAAGAVVLLTVTGRNSAGESPASEPVEFTVP